MSFRIIISVFVLLLGLPALSAPSESAKAEIAYLFNYLQTSGCTFNRNGSWHSAVDAVEHLKNKYDYLLKKDMITTTESFIERGASKSSMSGKAYLVQCAGTVPVESAIWLKTGLEQFRAQRGK